jgi:hypothetical protein
MKTTFHSDRRGFLTRSAMAGSAMLMPRRSSWAAKMSEPVVETTYGKIRGAEVNGISAFKGVPYGASTAGTNRFMPPRKPTPWGGVRAAADWAGHAPQAFAGARRPEGRVPLIGSGGQVAGLRGSAPARSVSAVRHSRQGPCQRGLPDAEFVDAWRRRE